MSSAGTPGYTARFTGLFSDVPWTNVGIQMAISFTFWYAAGFILGGDKWSPALIGSGVSGVMAVVKGPAPMGTLPDNIGVVSGKGYERAGSGVFDNVVGATFSAIVTFVFWLLVGYFVISGSAWKYAMTAAAIAFVGGLTMF